MGQIACTKHRRFRKVPPSIIRVDGEYNSVVALNNYHIDSRGQIVEKSTMATVGVSVNDNAYKDVPDQEDHPPSDTEEVNMDEND
jgi:hypothetical protein